MKLDVKTPKSIAVSILKKHCEAAEKLGYPNNYQSSLYIWVDKEVVFATNEEELESLASKAFSYSDQILIEESLKDGKKLNMKWYAIVTTIVLLSVIWKILIRLEFIPVKVLLLHLHKHLSNTEYHKFGKFQ